MSEWTDHVAKWKDCTNCPLCQQRDRICLARGRVPADIVFIGEAPGASEDAIGVPFIGPAGKLLDQIIERAVPPDLSYALTNLVACFPREAKLRGDNEPERNEIIECQPRLVEFIRLCRPRLIVLVGVLAKMHIPGAAMFRLDHQPKQPEWIPEGRYLEFLEIVHPAAILGHMPLAQKNYAVQRCIVQVRCAIDTVFYSTGDTNAEVKQEPTDEYRWMQDRDDDIPF